MADALQTQAFIENGAKIYSRNRVSVLANFAKIAGFAAVVTVLYPTSPKETPRSAAVPDVAVIDAINKVVAFKPLTGMTGLNAINIASTSSINPTVETRPAIEVDAVVDAVTRLRLDELNAANVHHQYGDYKVPHKVLKELVRAANDADFPTDYLFGIVEKESRFDCSAAPPSGSARGCMQVIDQTWLRMVKDYGSKFGLAEEAGMVDLTYNKRKQPVYKVRDPDQAKRILDLRYDVYYAAALSVTDLKSAKARIEKNLSVKFDDDNLYLPHFLGEDRAEVALAAFENRPNATASKIFNREARANSGMFYNGKGRRKVAIDVAGFIKRAQNVILSRSGKYHDVEQVAQKNSLDFVAPGNIPVPIAKPNQMKDSFINSMNARIAARKLPSLPEENIGLVGAALNTDVEYAIESQPRL
jgi:hypothetical protein